MPRFRSPITLSDADKERLEKAKHKLPTVKADWPAAKAVFSAIRSTLPKVSIERKPDDAS